MNTMRELPIGIQDFEKLQKNDCLYVDKTQYVYQLGRTSKPYFLGRPPQTCKNRRRIFANGKRCKTVVNRIAKEMKRKQQATIRKISLFLQM